MLRIFTAFLFSVFLAFNLLTGNAWASGQFSQTCGDINLNGSTLTATCKKADGYAPSTSSIDLNQYIENIDGTLEWNGAKFALTCNNLGLVRTSTLRAECERADQVNTLGTYINLDEHIANIDGTLRFE
jgi:hypothetical protein